MTIRFWLLVFLVAPSWAWAQVPLGTAFSYQGRLTVDGAPANGPYDLTFRLHANAAGASPVGSPVVKEDVTVSGGLFDVGLDFGPGVFTGEARWLEIAVRPGASTDAFTTLSPRVELRPTPNAVYGASTPWSGIIARPPGFADDVDNDLLGGLTCANGEIPKWMGSGWACGSDLVGSGGADITGVLAGPGLTGGGSSGDVTLAVNFAGDGFASTVARSDHDHFGQGWSGSAGTGLSIQNSSASDQTAFFFNGGGGPGLGVQGGSASRAAAEFGNPGGGLAIYAEGNGSSSSTGFFRNTGAGVTLGLENTGNGSALSVQGGGSSLAAANFGNINGGLTIFAESNGSSHPATVFRNVGGGSALFAETNSATAPAANFQGTGAGQTVWVQNTGGGSALGAMANSTFSTVNLANTGSGGALFASSHSPNATVFFRNLAGGSAIGAETNSATSPAANFQGTGAGETVWIQNTGGGSALGAVVSSDFSAVNLVNTGSGGALFAEASSALHPAAFFRNTGGSGMRVETNSATAPAASFAATGAGTTISVQNTGGGAGIGVQVNGAGDAANFANTGGGGTLNAQGNSPVAPTAHLANSGGGPALGAFGASASVPTGAFNNDGGGPALFVGSSGDTIITSSSGASLTGGNWVNASDAALKHNFAAVDRADLLDKVVRLPITSWSYKSDGRGVRHIGPTAQDFEAAFGLGGDARGISTVDPSGIALAAVQELQRVTRELNGRIRQLEEEVARLRREAQPSLASRE